MAKCPDEGLAAVGRTAVNTPHLERREETAVSQSPGRVGHVGEGPGQPGSGKGRFHPESTGRSQRDRCERPGSAES